MDEILWNEVSEGAVDSLEDVVLSGSTSRRCRGLRELCEKIIGNSAALPLSIAQLTFGKTRKSHRNYIGPFCNFCSEHILSILTVHPVWPSSNVFALSFKPPCLPST
jgi:hypothetical protein